MRSWRLVGALAAFAGGASVASPIIGENLVFVSLLTLGCYQTGRLLFGPRAGLLASIFVLGSPLLIAQLHVFMLDAPDVIRKKLARAQTDAQPEVRFPAGPGVTNLLEIYRTIHDKDWASVEKEFAGKPYSVLKTAVADAVIEALSPIQQRYREIRSNDAALLQQLRGAAERLTPIANTTLHRVQQAVGLR